MESSRSRKRARQDWDGAGAPPPPAERAVVARGGASPPWRDDDRDGHYVFDLGENLNRRYKILSKMGEGWIFCNLFPSTWCLCYYCNVKQQESF
jgi:dual-specificity kinase